MARSSAQGAAHAKRKHDGRPREAARRLSLRHAGRAGYFARYLPVLAFVVKLQVALLTVPALFLATTRQ